MWDAEHTQVIVNPTSGVAWLRSNWDKAERRLHKHLPGAQIIRTQAPGDGAKLAQQAISKGFTTIVSFGGDGTHSEIVDGIMRSKLASSVRLGILHAGTGGDFRKMIQGNERFSLACRNIRDAKAHAIDVGKIRYLNDLTNANEERYFLNIASLGVSGLVDKFVGNSRKLLGGRASFFIASLRANKIYKAAHVRITLDGREYGEFDINIVCVCNGRRAGAGMMFAPQARLSDGLFDVVVIKSAPMHRLLKMGSKLYTGTHVYDDLVHVVRAKKVEVEVLQRRAWVDVDGEAPGIGPACFEVIPSAIQLIAPKPDVL